MIHSNGFYTLKGYSSLTEGEILTSAMEDYLEMMYRLHIENEPIRIKRIAEILHVKPSSASKMASTLREAGTITFKKYGQITLTEKGILTGKYLLERHNILHQFFCRINKTENELVLVEKIEHFINRDTVYNIKRWLDKAQDFMQ